MGTLNSEQFRPGGMVARGETVQSWLHLLVHVLGLPIGLGVELGVESCQWSPGGGKGSKNER